MDQATSSAPTSATKKPALPQPSDCCHWKAKAVGDITARVGKFQFQLTAVIVKFDAYRVQWFRFLSLEAKQYSQKELKRAKFETVTVLPTIIKELKTIYNLIEAEYTSLLTLESCQLTPDSEKSSKKCKPRVSIAVDLIQTCVAKLQLAYRNVMALRSHLLSYIESASVSLRDIDVIGETTPKKKSLKAQRKEHVKKASSTALVPPVNALAPETSS